MKIVTVLIPCFNEEKGVVKVLRGIPAEELRRQGYSLEVVVVDNNSTDRTAENAANLGAKVVTESRQGKGFALVRGFAVASGEVIVTIDGDNTYPPEEISQLVEAVGRSDLVIGSRFEPLWRLNRLRQPHQLAWPRVVANKIGAVLASLILQHLVTDVTTGLRVFRKSLLTEIAPIRAKGLDFEAEFTARVIKQGLRYSEVRIGSNSREGQSSLRYARDAAKFLWAMMRGKYF